MSPTKDLILFTMDGCPYCVELKEMLKKENIDYHERDIDVHREEYDYFCEIVGNEYVPAFMIVEDIESDSPKPNFYAPERDFMVLDEAVGIIKESISI